MNNKTGDWVPIFLAVVSGENSLTVTLGSIHCIHRLTFPLEPLMLLIFCSRVTVSAKGPSSPAGTESPWGGRNRARSLARQQNNTTENQSRLHFCNHKLNKCPKHVLCDSTSMIHICNHLFGNATFKSFGGRWTGGTGGTGGTGEQESARGRVKCCVKLSPALTPE